jgi:hypothetical protein
MCESVPPAFALPFLFPPRETDFVILVLAKKKWPVEIKDVEKRIIVEDIDRCSVWDAAHEPCLVLKLISVTGGGSAPLLLGLAIHFN